MHGGTVVTNGKQGSRVEDVYDFGQELGRGAFSVVRHARHKYCGTKAAIKIIESSRFKSNTRAKAAIQAEIEALQRIKEHAQSPCLIRLLEVFADPSKVCIVLEELNGGELFDRIVARGRYTERDAAQLLYKLAVALGDCHAMGVVHRDVKPENIMYVTRDEDSDIKLTDFGLAMLEPRGHPSIVRRDANLVGTPAYVAPEVLQSRLYGPPCDVWACGVIAYVLLAGYPPFFATSDESLFDVIKKGKYFFHSDAWDPISAEAKDLVHQMLTVDLTRRATIDTILTHPWVTQESVRHERHLSGTLKRLKAFNAKRKWRAVATVVMLGANLGSKKRNRSENKESNDDEEEPKFSDSEMQILRQAFHSSAEGGVLGRAELAHALKDVGFGPVPSDRLFDLFDADGNGQVDYTEFIAGISSFRHSGEKALRFCFDVYDLDGVGAINMEQLKSVVSCVMQTDTSEGSSCTTRNEDLDLTEMFKKFDVDGNGTIDYEEFKAGVKREPLLVNAFLAPVQQGSLVPMVRSSKRPKEQLFTKPANRVTG